MTARRSRRGWTSWLRPWPAVVATLVLAGCGASFQAGLVNVPSYNRPWTADDFAHDVIANGSESCPRAGSAEQDRLYHRWPPCGPAQKPIHYGHRPASETKTAPPPLLPLREPNDEP